MYSAPEFLSHIVNQVLYYILQNRMYHIKKNKERRHKPNIWESCLILINKVNKEAINRIQLAKGEAKTLTKTNISIIPF